MLNRVQLSVGFLLAFAFCLSASADVILMTDGRKFEGTVVADRADSVMIDTVVATIRVTLTLPKSDIASRDKKPVPAGFYDPAPAEPRISDPTKFADPGSAYLEVPIKGVFGKDVLASGIRSVLSYARTHRVGHVVFVVDSEGGDLDEAMEIYQLLKSQFGKLRLHAILQNCQGDALSIPAACDTINVLPGAKVGGLGRKLADVSAKHAKEDELVFRRQMANELEATAKQRGRGGRVIRAMVDPLEAIAAWRTETGEVKLGSELPSDVPKNRVILTNGTDAPLMIAYEQAIALGMPPFAGGAQDLGKALDISQWTLESDFGLRAMTKAAADKAKTEANLQNQFDSKVKTNVARRETTDRAIQENMKQASEWAPTKESYATYKNYGTRWNWGYGRGYYGGDYEGTDTNRLTQESRKKWRDRTDACMHYLVEARSAMMTMQRLDKEAMSLGLAPTYKADELEMMIKDIEMKVVYLNNHRIKTTQ